MRVWLETRTWFGVAPCKTAAEWECVRQQQQQKIIILHDFQGATALQIQMRPNNLSPSICYTRLLLVAYIFVLLIRNGQKNSFISYIIAYFTAFFYHLTRPFSPL